MNVTIYRGEKFVVTFSSGYMIVLTHAEWMELRKMQNSLIYTEPNISDPLSIVALLNNP